MLRAGTSLAFILLFSSIVVTGAVIHVPSDQPTIQAGIDAAVDGDTVLVADGTYTGSGNRDISFRGKAITVRSESGAENCIIDCEEQGSGFHFTNGESLDSVLDGFTIRNGESFDGGGIFCNGSSPTITNCTFSDNTADYFGGGFFCYLSSPTITNCTFSANHVGDYYYGYGSLGGGICCFHSSPTITNCTFSANHAGGWEGGNGGGIYCESSSSTITNCTFSANGAHGGGYYPYAIGGGIVCGDSTTITNCTFSDNTADDYGGGIFCYGSSSTITNCIVWNNSPDGIHDALGVAIVSYSDVQGGWLGEGNIDADPLFVAGPEGDYYLSQVAAGQVEDSPCIDAGSEAAECLCFNIPEGFTCLDHLTTRTDHVNDTGLVDMGFHYGEIVPLDSVSAELTCVPLSGIIPFQTHMSVDLNNPWAGPGDPDRGRRQRVHAGGRGCDTEPIQPAAVSAVRGYDHRLLHGDGERSVRSDVKRHYRSIR